MNQVKIKKLLFLFFLFAYTTSNAQLGASLVKKAINAKKNKSGMELDWTVFDQEPTVTYSSLLDGVSVYENGDVNASYFFVTFISNIIKKNGKMVDWIDDEERFLSVKTYKGDQYIGTMAYSQPRPSYGDPGDKTFAMTHNGIIDGEQANVSKHGVGVYRLDFYAGTRMFYQFEFEAYKVKNEDTYADLQEMYLAKGPWNEYAFLKSNSSGIIEFGFYLTHEEFKPNVDRPRDLRKEVFWYADLYKDGKLAGTTFSYKNQANDQGNKLRSTPEQMDWNTATTKRGKWGQYGSTFHLVDKSTKFETVYAPFRGLEDGNYEVKLKLESEEVPRTYAFTVSGGKIVLPDYQDRSKVQDATKLIEGWNDHIWMKRDK